MHDLQTLLFKIVNYGFILIATFVVISLLIYFIKRPSNNKKWFLGHSKTASISIEGDHVEIKNFRDVDWLTLNSTTLLDDNSFKDIEFKLSDIQSLKAVVSRFAILSEIAHIFIFFELKDKTSIGLSIEARKREGQRYSLFGGLTARFDIIYLFSSYRDLIDVRLMRNEKVYSFPIKSTPEEIQSLFRVAAYRTNLIKEEPELYHLFLRNCTTEIVKLVDEIAEPNFSRWIQSFFPGYAGKALFDMGLIDTEAKKFKDAEILKPRKDYLGSRFICFLASIKLLF